MIKYWNERKVSYTGDYPRVYWPEHPMSDCIGMLKIHRAVMAEIVGRILVPSEIVHHKDENRLNWEIENLELTNLSDHAFHHGNVNAVYTPCGFCSEMVRVWGVRAEKYNRYFCDTYCHHKFQERIDWPSDSVLSKLVWIKPATSLAKEWGVSDRAIQKRCKRRGIPTPPRGYWAKNK